MIDRYSLETEIGVQNLAPQQADFYFAQLGAISNLTMGGADAELAVGLGVERHFLPVGSTPQQNVSALIWRPSIQPVSANFAVLPPQDASRKYFGVATQVDGSQDTLMIEGVSAHATGSEYARVRVSYAPTVGPDRRLAIGIGAFIDNVRRPTQKDADPNTRAAGIDTATHRKLGNALLSFWDTVHKPSDLSNEHIGSRSAFELARLVIARQIEQAEQGQPSDKFDSVTPFRDERGAVVGFVGQSERFGTITAMVRNNLQYPERVDFIQIPRSQDTEEQQVLVEHHAITESDIASRFCVLPVHMVTRGNLAELLAAIRNDRRPLEPLDTEAVSDVVLGLHADLGRLLQQTSNEVNS